jgi:hypothetical protein
MTRMKFLFAALVVAAIVAVTPAANALGTGTPPCAAGTANCHVVAAGSSAQFLTAMIGADALAFNGITHHNDGTAGCTYHWSAKNSSNLLDNRNGAIPDELGNTWIVWAAALDPGTTVCATGATPGIGATGITDIWLDSSVDSTVGVRAFLAQEIAGTAGTDAGPGALVQIITPTGAGANLVSPDTLLADATVDVAALPAAIASAIGTGRTGNVHVNVGLTDIRPEDALFATVRANSGPVNPPTYTKLGYTTINHNIGAQIATDQGTGTKATPIAFALAGANDPFDVPHVVVPAFTTIPIGAAPVIFVYHNGGAFEPNVANLVSNVSVEAGPFNASHLFDGTTVCDDTSTAFGGTGLGGGTAINLILREPLSGTMNTTEFDLFRTDDNHNGSQETGINPANGFGDNQLHKACTGGGGLRSRAIGTGEVVNAVLGSAHTLGYIFQGFGNIKKFTGVGVTPNFQYLLLDGKDPFGGLVLPTTSQQLPACGGPCPASLWTNNLSYTTLRDGTYKAWSLLRWVAAHDITTETDGFGPAHLAQAAQDAVDTTVADFVPFFTATGGVGGVSDGLDVYRSHFTQSGKVGNNGKATTLNATDGGNTLGGGTEAGGDEGGLIEGPFPKFYSGTADVTNGSAAVSRDTGTAFVTGTSWVNNTIVFGGTGPNCLGGNQYTILSVTSTSALTLTANYAQGTADAQNFCVAVASPGTLNAHQ